MILYLGEYKYSTSFLSCITITRRMLLYNQTHPENNCDSRQLMHGIEFLERALSLSLEPWDSNYKQECWEVLSFLCCVFGRIIRLRATPGKSTASEDKANYSVVCNGRQETENKTASLDLMWWWEGKSIYSTITTFYSEGCVLFVYVVGVDKAS